MEHTAMTTTRSRSQPAVSGRTTGSRRFGYLVAIVANAVMLYLAHHLLTWGWPRFLTDDFEELLPVVTVSFVAGMVANAAFVCFDAAWFKSLANIVTSAIAFVVALRTFQVFPFDFSGYDHDWSWLVRLVLVVGMAGAAISVVVESVRVFSWSTNGHASGEE
jgi:hypothetical protein